MTIYMGLSPKVNIKEYWIKTCKKGVDHFTVRKNMGKNCWQQIDLKLYISFPKHPNNKIKESPFNKIAALNNTLYDYFQLYWILRTHLTINKTIT